MARPPERAAFDDAGVTEAVIARYLANKRVIEGMAAAVRVEPVFVWQPIPVYKYDLAYHVHRGDFGGHEYARFGYPRMAERLRAQPAGDDFVWCADIQENAKELLYVDQVHYSPRMSAMLAECIFRGLRRPERAS